MIRTIVVPLDGSALADAAVPHARGLAAESGATVVLVRAVHGWDTRGGHLAAVTQADGYLQAVPSSPALSGVTVHADVVRDRPAEAIARVATQWDADLIVIPISLASHFPSCVIARGADTRARDERRVGSDTGVPANDQLAASRRFVAIVNPATRCSKLARSRIRALDGEREGGTTGSNYP